MKQQEIATDESLSNDKACLWFRILCKQWLHDSTSLQLQMTCLMNKMTTPTSSRSSCDKWKSMQPTSYHLFALLLMQSLSPFQQSKESQTMTIWFVMLQTSNERYLKLLTLGEDQQEWWILMMVLQHEPSVITSATNKLVASQRMQEWVIQTMHLLWWRSRMDLDKQSDMQQKKG